METKASQEMKDKLSFFLLRFNVSKACPILLLTAQTLTRRRDLVRLFMKQEKPVVRNTTGTMYCFNMWRETCLTILHQVSHTSTLSSVSQFHF